MKFFYNTEKNMGLHCRNLGVWHVEVRPDKTRVNTQVHSEEWDSEVQDMERTQGEMGIFSE